MNNFLIALQFITRIPVKFDLEYDKESLASSMIYYPIVGLLLGLILTLINYLGELFLTPLVTNSLLVIGMIIFTGGIHLDGLMDTCDGIFSGREKSRMLEIMRDSRVGAFGVVGLVSVILLKFSLLVEAPSFYKKEILIYAPTVSRWAMVYVAFNYPYARKGDGLGKAYAQYLKLRHFLLATALTLLIGIILFDLAGVMIFLGSWLITVIIAKIIIAKIDGLTGDNYGAINELLEVGLILITVIMF